jgi:hypothetical protein
MYYIVRITKVPNPRIPPINGEQAAGLRWTRSYCLSRRIHIIFIEMGLYILLSLRLAPIQWLAVVGFCGGPLMEFLLNPLGGEGVTTSTDRNCGGCPTSIDRNCGGCATSTARNFGGCVPFCISMKKVVKDIHLKL